MHRSGSAYGLDVAGRVLALAEQKLNIIQATCSNQFWLWRGWSAAISAEKAVSTALAFDLRQRRMIFEDVPTRASRAGEPCWPPSRGSDVPGRSHRRRRSHRQTDFGTAAQVPRKTFVLFPWRQRSRGPRRTHPRRQVTRRAR
jgi:hypothetical protein